MDKYREMQSFTAVVDAGSFVGAADTLVTSKAAISRHVVDLEQRLGVRLLNRTTRKLSLTDEGRTFYQQCKEILGFIDAAEAEVNSRTGEASGLLRLNVPVSFGIQHLAPLWGKFTAAHPKVKLDLSLSDRAVDLVEEGYDLAIRISRLPSSSLICRKLASTRMVVCASPQYLRRRGKPKRPEDLADHDVISYSYWSTQDEWQFEGPAGPVSVKTHPRIYANNGDTCRAAALLHQGIVLQPTFLVGDDLREGHLIELLAEYQTVELGVYALYASRKLQPLKVRLLIDFLVEAFRRPKWPD
ncbi:MAG: LysR family transcriptional regulator [Gammaproteobacteria bacterium]|nr:LysR family transcriptional regulator [Gammaproteobacteria bacterium]